MAEAEAEATATVRRDGVMSLPFRLRPSSPYDGTRDPDVASIAVSRLMRQNRRPRRVMRITREVVQSRCDLHLAVRREVRRTTMGLADEHIEAAHAAGLRYVTDTTPGIRRRRRGRGFAYIGPDGLPVRDVDELDRIRKLVIPPRWSDVWICPLPHGHLQVTARDGRGRKQYRYHVRYRAIRDDTKFSRMVEFSEVLPCIREHVERHISSPQLSREKVLATVVWLLEKTLIRVGSDEYARDNGSFGLTTLRRRHVEVSGAKLRFEFRGKSGVPHSVAVTDRRIARIVQHCQELPGQELFQYLDESGRRQSVDAGDINEYLRKLAGRQVTAKDFRTWAGTMLAAAALRDIGLFTTQKEANANIVRAIDQVAKRLGNTRAVCRKYYVHPAVIEAYLEGFVLPVEPDERSRTRDVHRTSGLRRDEIAVVELLRQRSNHRIS